jgi:formylglycine-generating enzyme required for sulfatase activity
MPMPLQGSRTSTRAFAAVCAIAAGLLLLVVLLNTSPSPKIQSLQTDISAEQRIEDKKQNNLDTVDSKAEVPQSVAEIPVEPIDHPWIQELRIPFSAGIAKEYQQRWADALGIAVEVQNQFGMPFVLIPPGEFLMGYSSEDFKEAMDKATYDSERKSITAASKPILVRISHPFYISKYELSEAERIRVLRTDHSLPSVLDVEYAPVRPRWISPDHPATRIPWKEAQLICQKLNELGGILPFDGIITREQLGFPRYRLPTEAEWEWACRAGRSGANISDSNDYKDEVWSAGNATGTVHFRGLKNPNPFGLYDMLGNVQEWCLDNFATDYAAVVLASKGSVVNPLATSDEPQYEKGHVLRGGAISFGELITNFSFKLHREELSTSWFTGLRIVIPIAPEAIEKCKLDLQSR